MLLPDFPKENENINKKVLTQSKRDEIKNKLVSQKSGDYKLISIGV